MLFRNSLQRAIVSFCLYPQLRRLSKGLRCMWNRKSYFRTLQTLNFDGITKCQLKFLSSKISVSNMDATQAYQSLLEV